MKRAVTREFVPALDFEEIEDHRDAQWHRDERYRVETVDDAERFVEEVGFARAFQDSRKPGPSLYVAVCGRRDAVMPTNVQTDPETSLSWQLKDEMMRRGKVYYAKMCRGRAMFVAPRMIRYFRAIWGIPRRREPDVLSDPARKVLAVLRREWEMGTADLRAESGVTGSKDFSRALDELQAAMIVVPGEAVYSPKFSYIWELASGRFHDELSVRTSRSAALEQIALCYLEGAGMTARGELARVTGLSRAEAGLGNHALVRKGLAERPDDGVYRLVRRDGDYFMPSRSPRSR
jgi:hypothetical protein